MMSETKLFKGLLKALNVNNYTDYNKWIEILFICKNENVDFEIFNNWCRSIDGYNQSNNLKIWCSLKLRQEGPKLKLVNLMKIVQKENVDTYYEILKDLPMPNIQPYNILKQFIESQVIRINNEDFYLKYNFKSLNWDIVGEDK